MMENKNNRREFIKATGMAGLAAGLSFTAVPGFAKVLDNDSNTLYTGKEEEIPYEQQSLPYSYQALEPAIDAQTMEIHYSKHAATYAKNLADAVKAEGVNTGTEKLSSLLRNISAYSLKMRNNAGGHYNHEFFWKSMKAPAEGNPPEG